MKKTLAMILAVVMLMTACVAGTLAWLQDSTQEVKNTFTVGNIDITLAETGTTTVEGVDTKSYKMIPGATLSKDPKVTVEAGSEACYVFVKIEESATLDTYIAYTVADGWTELTTGSNIWWRTQDATTADVTYSVLAGDQVTVNQGVTKAQMDALNAENAVQPTLTFKAYAIQSANLTDQNGDSVVDAADAWKLLGA